jgi:hypothetical protein
LDHNGLVAADAFAFSSSICIDHIVPCRWLRVVAVVAVVVGVVVVVVVAVVVVCLLNSVRVGDLILRALFLSCVVQAS